MKRSQKPVRKCHGCGLNLGDRCGIYEVPRDMWHRRLCPGYRNEEKLMEFWAEQEARPVDKNKEKRREVAKQRSTEPHYQGTLPFGIR